MESNFQKCTRDWCRGGVEPRRRYTVEGRRPFWRVARTWTPKLKVYCWGAAVEHMLDNADVAVHYEITNANVPCMGIQADWYRPFVIMPVPPHSERVIKQYSHRVLVYYVRTG